MEGIQTIQALKAVQSSLPAQTTIPSDELVMLYAADGTPIAKIARDDLVKAVASVMASNSQTTFSKLLGVQANGTPMGIGASDLASVLGGQLGINVYSIEPSATDAPFPEGYTGIVFQYKGLAGVSLNVVLCEIAFKGSSTAQGSSVSEIKVRHKYANGPFTSWQKMTLTT